MSPLLTAVQVAVCLAVVLGVAWLGRAAARALRQPEVVGEITLGLAAGPALHAVLGTRMFALLLPTDVVGWLKFTGEAGLALYLVGLTHELRLRPHGDSRKLLSWIVFGALVPPLVAGTALAGLLLLLGDPRLRGTAPLPAFVLFFAIALAITAVPVLARILGDRGLTTTRAGRLALTGAIVLDGAGWVLLSVVIGLDKRTLTGTVWVLATMAALAAVALLVRWVLNTNVARTWVSRGPRVSGVAVGVGAVVAAISADRLGLSMIFGAVLFGLTIPSNRSTAVWTDVVVSVTRVGRLISPTFFVITGVQVITNALGAAPWTVIVAAVVLGLTGKIGGGYLGARLGGEPHLTAARIGVLLDTRGLTELIVLQAGYAAGILTAPGFLALVIMALGTTALTGPLVSLLDRVERREGLAANQARPVDRALT